MRGHFLLGLGAALFAAITPLAGAEPPAASQAAPGLRPTSGLNPYSLQQNPIIDGPSTDWLIPAMRPKGPVVWCNLSDPWDQILRIDGLDALYLTDNEVAAYLSGAHGWPVNLIVEPKSGGTRAVACFQHG